MMSIGEDGKSRFTLGGSRRLVKGNHTTNIRRDACHIMKAAADPRSVGTEGSVPDSVEKNTLHLREPVAAAPVAILRDILLAGTTRR